MEESIFELGRFAATWVSNDESASEIACVHDKKFFMFHHGEGQLIPLVGTAQPATEIHSTAPDHESEHRLPHYF
jgi:hypothetical protein